MDHGLPRITIVGRTRRAALCVALWAVAVPCTAAPRELDRIVAVVENEVITERQLVANIRGARASLERQNRDSPDERALTAQVLQQMIIQQLQLQEAKSLGITIDDITLDRALESMAERNGLSLAGFKSRVESDGGNFEELRRKVRNDLTIQKLVQREVVNRIEVSDREIEELLMLGEARRRDREYRFVHVRTPPEKAAEAGRLFAWVRQRLRGNTFSSLNELRQRLARLWKAAATEDNAEKPRYRTKDLGWRRVENLPAPVRRRIDAIRDAGVSPIITNDDGTHLFVLLETRGDSPEMMQLQYHVRHVLVQTDPINDDDKVRRRMVRIKRQLEEGADFDAIACQHSQDPLSSMKGGDLGWTDLSGYAPEFAEAVKRARGKGDIVGPFKTSFGWHLLEVLDTREHDVGDHALRQQAITEIRKSKSEEEIRLWLLGLRETRRVEIRI